MRIFYASDTTPHGALASSLWRDNLYLPLVDLGHEMVEFDCDLRPTFLHLDTCNPQHQAFIARNRPRVTEALLAQVKAAHLKRPVDLLFSYFYDACVEPEAIDAIKAMGITTVNWYCNGSYQMHLVAQIAPHYDWCLVPEKFRLADYRALGARPLYCQEAANPNIYKPYDVPVEFDVTFVGQAYGERPAYLKALHDAEIDVHAWGYGWQPPAPAPARSPVHQAARHVRALWHRLRAGQVLRPPSVSDAALLPEALRGGPLSDLDMVRMYSRSRINLGFSVCGDTHRDAHRILQVRLRDFEVPMSGGFYMVEYMEELEEFYEIGKEIVCYHNSDDLTEKIRYYLAHDSERERIRHAGRERCLRDHTWHRRFQAAFAQMGLA